VPGVDGPGQAFKEDMNFVKERREDVSELQLDLSLLI
jgi:hypothetical protein